jgi:hypothetical protein
MVAVAVALAVAPSGNRPRSKSKIRQGSHVVGEVISNFMPLNFCFTGRYLAHGAEDIRQHLPLELV